MKIITIIKRTVLGILIVFVAMLVFGLILQKTGYQPKNAPRATEIEQAVTTEIEPSVPVMSNQEQPKKEAVVQAKTEYISQNLLMQKTLREVSIRNAVNKKIGTRAYIEIPGNVLLEVVSLDDITEFYKSFQGKNYNWISIICPDAGSGLVFGGNDNPIVSYGKTDELGRLAGPAVWSIIYDAEIGRFKKLEF